MEDFVIEAQVVETHDEIGALQFREQLIDLVLAIDPILPARAAVGDADAHAHVADLVPTTDVLGGFLGFEIEVQNIFGHRENETSQITYLVRAYYAISENREQEFLMGSSKFRNSESARQAMREH